MKGIKLAGMAIGLLMIWTGPKGSAWEIGTRRTAEGGEETKTAELLPNRKGEDGRRLLFKFRAVRYADGGYGLKVYTTLDNKALYVIVPGLTLELEDGGSVVLRPEADGFDHWGAGEWYNAEFRLDDAVAERLRESDVVRITIADRDGALTKDIPGRRQGLLSEAIDAVAEE